MTEAVFLKILNMALSAGYLVLAVLVLRLALRRAPRWVHCVLWGLVGVRLVCPFTLESVLSLIPSREVVSPTITTSPSPQIQSGMPLVDGSLNPVIGQTMAPDPIASVNPMQVVVAIAAYVWVAGAVVMLTVALVSYWRLRRRVAEATPLRDNIFQCENLPTTFILGIFKPRIYISYTISEEDLPLVLAHEQAHLRRRDHWIKPLAYLLLLVYWFHPLVWVGYVLLCRDIELACDEKVMRTLGSDTRRAYATALLHNGTHSRRIAACPLAFGEVGIKERVKSVMHYKKPTFWIVLAAVVACTVVAVCFLTSPKTAPTVIDCGTVDEDITIRVTELELEGDDPHVTVRWKNESRWTLYPIYDDLWTEYEPEEEPSFGATGAVIPDDKLDEGVEPGESRRVTYSLSDHTFDRAGTWRLYISFARGWDTMPAWVTFTVPEKLAERLENFSPAQSMSADVTGDGMEETIQLREIGRQHYNLEILSQEGTLLWKEEFSESHVGWNSLYLCATDEGNYLLRYNPYTATGLGFYNYCLFRPDNGQEVVKAKRELHFDLNGRQAFDVPEMVEFADEINALLKNSVLLFSTDWNVVGDPRFGPLPGEQFLETYDFLDDFDEDIYAKGDDLATRLQKLSDHMMASPPL